MHFDVARFPVQSRWRLIILAVTAAGATAAFAMHWTPYGIDDAWITYRYAEHLEAGHGFVYNIGERVLGTSTPLYTLLLASASLAGLPVPGFSYAVGYLSMLAALLGVYLLTRRIHSEAAALLAVVFLVLMQQFHRVATYGMETPLYVCLIVFAFYAYARDRWHVAAVLAALCLLMRLDGAAVGAGLLVTHVLKHRRFPWALAVVYVAVAAPWFAFSQWYFGSPLPNSFVAKQHHMTSVIHAWLVRWLLARPHAIPALLGVAVMLLDASRRLAILPLAVWSSSYVVAYTVSGLWRYEWYLTPMTIPLAVFGAIGVAQVAARVVRSPQRIAVAATALGLLVLSPDAYGLLRQIQRGRYTNQLESARFEASQWMQRHLPADAPIATGGIGMPGYFTGNYIIDSAGLVSPQVVGETGIEFFLETAVQRYRPRYVLLSSHDLHGFMKPDYEVLKTWETGDPLVPRFILACLAPCSPSDLTSTPNVTRGTSPAGSAQE